MIHIGQKEKAKEFTVKWLETYSTTHPYPFQLLKKFPSILGYLSLDRHAKGLLEFLLPYETTGELYYVFAKFWHTVFRRDQSINLLRE